MGVIVFALRHVSLTTLLAVFSCSAPGADSRDMDGVPGVTQSLVEPGERFDYDFSVPDAGLYWYHPHHRTVMQMGDGMYGAILVENPDEPPGIGQETILVPSDVSSKAETK